MVKCVERKDESLDKRAIPDAPALIINAIKSESDGFAEQIQTKCPSYIIISVDLMRY